MQQFVKDIMTNFTSLAEFLNLMYSIKEWHLSLKEQDYYTL